jgi:hypothetical protein
MIRQRCAGWLSVGLDGMARVSCAGLVQVSDQQLGSDKTKDQF